MNIPLVLVITLFTLLNISSFFALMAKTPIYTVFTGAVHYTTDYLYYLTFITQGKDHLLRSYNLFTGETDTLEFLNWIYVLAGHIGSSLHLSVPVIYQLMVVLGSIAYLVIAYKLVCLCIPKNTSTQFIAYILFLTSNAFPNIYYENGSWIFAFFYPFNNLGHPFIRLTNVPHHIYISCCIMLAFYIAGRFWQQKQRKRQIIILGVVGLLLSSMQPLQWAFVTGVLGISGMVVWWQTRRISAFFPAIILFLTGLIPAAYLRHLYSLPPYSNMVAWESLQQIRIPFLHFIRLNGPVMLLGILGIPWIIRSMSITVFSLLLYSVIAILLFFSDIPSRLNMMNIRFISIIPTFAASYISAEIIWRIAKKIDASRTKLCAWFIAFLILAITVPVTIRHLYDRSINAPPEDMNTYLPLGAHKIYEVAQKTIGPTDTVLVDFIYSASFAGLTGKHVFVTNRLGTIDFDRKLAEANIFFYKPGDPDAMITWLKNNNISYIFANAWTPVNLPNLEIIDSNAYAVLYKVE
jgi:hypothetical protein